MKRLAESPPSEYCLYGGRGENLSQDTGGCVGLKDKLDEKYIPKIKKIKNTDRSQVDLIFFFFF